MMIGGVTIMMIVASCCLIDTGVLDLWKKKERKKERKPSKHRMSRSNSIMGYSIN
jgi:hypothetical protein